MGQEARSSDSNAAAPTPDPDEAAAIHEILASVGNAEAQAAYAAACSTWRRVMLLDEEYGSYPGNDGYEDDYDPSEYRGEASEEDLADEGNTPVDESGDGAYNVESG